MRRAGVARAGLKAAVLFLRGAAARNFLTVAQAGDSAVPDRRFAASGMTWSMGRAFGAGGPEARGPRGGGGPTNCIPPPRARQQTGPA